MLLDRLAQTQAQRTLVRQQFMQKVQDFSKDLLDILNDIDLTSDAEQVLSHYGIVIEINGVFKYSIDLNDYNNCQLWFQTIKPGLESNIPALIENLLNQETAQLNEIDAFLGTGNNPVFVAPAPVKPESISTSAVIDEDLSLIKGLEKVLPPAMQCVKCDKRYDPAEVFAIMDEGKLPIPKNCKCGGNLIRA